MKILEKNSFLQSLKSGHFFALRVYRSTCELEICTCMMRSHAVHSYPLGGHG